MRTFFSTVGLLLSININNYAMQPTPVPITEETEKFICNADKGDISYVVDALERNPQLLHAKDYMGYTALHRATIRNNLDMAVILINGAQNNYENLYKKNPAQYPLNTRDFEGNTALHHALSRGYTNLIEILLQAQADITIANNNNVTVEELLINQHAPENNNSNNLNTSWSPPSFNQNTITQPAITKYVNNTSEQDTQTIEQQLFKAVQENNISYIQETLEKGITPNIQTNLGSTLLHKAVTAGHETLVRFLLDKGADPNKQNSYGFTPLRYAMGKYSGDSCESLLTLLLNKGADHTILDNQGHTTLSITQDYVNWLVARGHAYAYVGRRIELLKNYSYLLEQAQQNPSREVLQEAIKHNFACIVRILLDSGIAITTHDLEQAQQHNARDVLEVLKNYS